MPQSCEHLVASGPARPPLLPMDPSQFQRWLTVAALGLLVVVLLGFVLYVCASIFQPLSIAGLLVYLILPTAWTGQTLGKRYTYCMVVDRATGQLPTTGQVIRRYIIPAFAFALLSTTGAVIGLLYGFSFLMNRDQISLSDRLARTAVVIARYKPERST